MGEGVGSKRLERLGVPTVQGFGAPGMGMDLIHRMDKKQELTGGAIEAL